MARQAQLARLDSCCRQLTNPLCHQDTGSASFPVAEALQLSSLAWCASQFKANLALKPAGRKHGLLLVA